MPDRTFPGKVTRIADALDPATRTLLTEIDFANPDGELSPGTYCTVELKIPRKTPSLIVPAGGDRFRRRPPRTSPDYAQGMAGVAQAIDRT
jgi:multidrug efflux pump subunit AcrA (membrane-fusion protein)